MTRSMTTYNAGAGTIALYKSTYQSISQQINAVLPRTNDSGQVNWTNVTTESSVIRDYELFAFNDALSATAPIVFRMDYIGGNIAGTSGARITVGTSSDGAGNVTGLTIPQFLLSPFGSPNTTKYAYAASDGSYFMLTYNIDPTAAYVGGAPLVVIERTRNADGTPNANGFMCWRWQADTNTSSVWSGTYARIYGATSQPALDWSVGSWIPAPANNNSAFIGATSYAFPCYGYAPWPQGASTALMIGYQADFPRTQEITMTHYGQNMKWLSMGTHLQVNVPTQTATTSVGIKTTYCPIVRWE